MKFSTTVSIALLALAKLIVADSESFGLVVIRSGSPLQYAGVYSEDGKLYFGSSGNGLSAVVTDAGKLKLSDDTYAVVSSDGSVVQGSESDATSGFSVSNGYLAYNGVDGFNAISSGSTYIVSTKSSGSNDLGVAIRATSSSGSTIPDFSPEDSSSTSTVSDDFITGIPAPSSEASTTKDHFITGVPAPNYRNATETFTSYETTVSTITKCFSTGPCYTTEVPITITHHNQTTSTATKTECHSDGPCYTTETPETTTKAPETTIVTKTECDKKGSCYTTEVPETKTKRPETTTLETQSSKPESSTSVIIQTENGAAHLRSAGLGAGILAAAALLI